MIDRLQAHSRMLAVISAGVGLAAMLASIGVLIRLPAHYFNRPADEQQLEFRYPWLRIAWLVCKNIVGVLLALFGLLMSLPLVPGPGIVLLVVGVSLTSFPRKRRFERALLGNHFLLTPINALRKKFGRQPFALHDANVCH